MLVISYGYFDEVAPEKEGLFCWGEIFRAGLQNGEKEGVVDFDQSRRIGWDWNGLRGLSVGGDGNRNREGRGFVDGKGERSWGREKFAG